VATEEQGHQEGLSAEEEEAKQRAAEDQRRAAAQQLAFGNEGLVAPTQALVQVTGGSTQVGPHELPKRDQSVRVLLRGWVKTDKTVTTKKGESAAREMIVVTEEILEIEVLGDAA